MGLRIALSQGLHRDIAGDSADDPEVRRYRNAWWTLYILDRKFSSLICPCYKANSHVYTTRQAGEEQT